MNKYLKKIVKNQRGDTIVEVMVSLIILSLVITSVYAIVSRSLDSGSLASQRTEALSLAQSQVDLLANARTNDPTFATDYQSNTPFCINTDGSKNTTAPNNSDKLCDSFSGTQYNVGVSYANNIFTITAQWPSATATGGQDNLNLYYKLPGVYKKAFVNSGSSSVNGTTVTVNGSVTPNGNPVTACSFVYDTSTNYTANSPTVGCTVSGSGNSFVPVSASFSSANLTPNTTYWFELCVTNLVGQVCSITSGTFLTGGPPVVNATSATNIGVTSATLNGTVDPGSNALTNCYFEYGNGASGAYDLGTKTCPLPWPGAGAGSTAEAVTVSGLSSGHAYHFHLVASNTIGTGTSSPPINFSTVPPPTVVTVSASNATYTSATLNGTVNPNGNNVTNCYFNYGTTLSYGSQVACSSLPGAGNSAVAVVGNASFGTSYATTYYYQICATNAAGTNCDPTVKSFITPAPAPPSASMSPGSQTINYNSTASFSWSSSNTTYCATSWEGNQGPSGSYSTPNLTSSQGYSITCYGLGGSASASTTVYVNPAPPPPPPDCSTNADGSRSGNYVYISGGGSGCGYYYDDVVGWNGGFGGRQYYSPDTFCHTQSGGTDPWGWISSSTWCG